MRHPRDIGSAEVNAFLSHLAVDEQVSASTQNQALSALLFLYRELVVQLPFVLQEQINSASSLFKQNENVTASLADAELIRLAEISDSPLLLTTNRDFHIYRRHGRQLIPLTSP